MKTEATWKRVQVFVGETDHYRGHTLFEAIVSMLHAEGVSGATAIKGVMGYGDSSLVHASHLLDIASDLPVMVVFADAEEVVDRVLPKLEEMLESGLVLVDDVSAVKFSRTL